MTLQTALLIVAIWFAAGFLVAYAHHVLRQRQRRLEGEDGWQFVVWDERDHHEGRLEEDAA